MKKEINFNKIIDDISKMNKNELIKRYWIDKIEANWYWIDMFLDKFYELELYWYNCCFDNEKQMIINWEKLLRPFTNIEYIKEFQFFLWWILRNIKKWYK